MKLPLQTAVVARARTFSAQRIGPTRSVSRVTPQVVRPSVDWWCLLRKAGGCVARCGTDIGCYATCAPGAIECF